jgi:hypothetical protein
VALGAVRMGVVEMDGEFRKVLVEAGIVTTLIVTTIASVCLVIVYLFPR